MEPLVSICCITYNHKPYIRDAIEGFLKQKTNFPIEIIIHDDASTDGTTDIIKEYEKKLPEIVFPIYQTENQYSKGVRGIAARYTFPRARGKYIALCEGDDYWTDPCKLQKQVDFLEDNFDYSLCVGGYSKFNVYTKERRDVIIKLNKVITNKNGYTFSLNEFTDRWITKTLTAVFRNYKELPEQLQCYKYGRDINLFYHLLKEGKGFYFTEVFGVYRIHRGGINSMRHGTYNNLASYNIHKELFNINKDNYCRQKYVKATLKLFNHYLYDKKSDDTWAKKWSLLKEIIPFIQSTNEIFIFIKSFLPKKLKLKLKNLFK